MRQAAPFAGDEILPEHLPALQRPVASPHPFPDAPVVAAAGVVVSPRLHPIGGADLQGEIRSLECARIIEALDRCGGNQSKAAELLEISRRTLVSRIAEFGLPRPRKPI